MLRSAEPSSAVPSVSDRQSAALGVRHNILKSGGAASADVALEVHRAFPKDEHRWVFTDTLYEDADLYRFLLEWASLVFDRAITWLPKAEDFPDYRVPADTPIEEYRGNPEWRAFLAELRERAEHAFPELAWIVEGRDVWEIYRDERFLGNSQIDPCSKFGKREPLKRWKKANCDRAVDVFYVGISEPEKHRYDNGAGKGIRPRQAKDGWDYRAPRVGVLRGEINPLVFIRQAGVEPPRLYAMGYSHNNCGGFCCKAGQAHNTNRFRVQPERAAYDALMERKMRAFLGSDVAMMKETARNGTRPLPLEELHGRLRAKPDLFFDYDNDSGCGCMIDGDAA